MTIYDVAIIGAGIAGASIASEIVGDASGNTSVVILEAESQPGYHATGRSAAFWTESYGGPQVQPLTTASCSFLENPPAEFSETGFLHRRGAINIAKSEDRRLADKFVSDFADSGVAMTCRDADQTRSSIPNLKAGWDISVFEPNCSDIDVAALHAAYLRHARRNGAELQCNSKVEAISLENSVWNIETSSGRYQARKIINAAGAWADDIAAMAGIMKIGIEPMRRTMVQLRTDPPSTPDMLLVVGLDGSFYFKPEAGGDYWLSPHDETPVAACDVAPEEMDIALAIDRFQSVLDVDVQAVTKKWAGLRSFAPDRLPVYGSDVENPDFFWFAGQGGFGIQTAPAAAKLGKALFLNQPKETAVQNIDEALYSPARFQ